MSSRFRSILDRAASAGGPSRTARSAPRVVLGTGGSGTRAVAEAMIAAGVYLGADRNRASDSLAYKPFLVRWSKPYVAESGWVQAVERDPGADVTPPPEITADLEAAISRQREGIPAEDALWGWKNPRTSNLLPVLNAVAPDALTAQLVRDGRDMAYSKNQNQLEDCAAILPEELREAPLPVRSIALWSRMNLATAAYMRHLKGDGHLVLRYEDLCAEPQLHLGRLLEHLQIPAAPEVIERAAEGVKLSSGAGRWKDAPAGELQEVERAGKPALREFGYM